HVFGRAINTDELGAMQHVASVDGLDLHCCFGASEEWTTAEGALRMASDVVVTPTALATLFMVGELDVLPGLGKTLLVSQSTKVILRQFLEEARRSHRSRASLRSSDEPPAEVDPYLESVERFVAQVNAVCQAVSCSGMAHLEPDERTRLVEGL